MHINADVMERIWDNPLFAMKKVSQLIVHFVVHFIWMFMSWFILMWCVHLASEFLEAYGATSTMVRNMHGPCAKRQREGLRYGTWTVRDKQLFDFKL